MILEQRPVSRKTPLDGKLEISAEAAGRVGALGPDIPVAAGGRQGTARLHLLACTCTRGSGGSHVHHFLESPLFRSLTPDARVAIVLDEEHGVLHIDTLRD